MYENKPITGSHVVDLPVVNDMLRHRKGFEPVGWSVFVRGLARMNVPENLVRNPQRQSAIREFNNKTRDIKDLITPGSYQIELEKYVSHMKFVTR